MTLSHQNPVPSPESAAPAIQGVVPIVPTPFHADESIDFDAVARCVRFAVSGKLSAVCLPAYASEFYKLSEREREQLVATAVAASAGRIAVVAQSNHPAATLAAELAQRHQQMGAAVISFAIPRQFALKESDTLSYCERICQAVDLPILIQDFNPAGTTVGPTFAAELRRRCPNFRWLKLEEPLMADKVRHILEATQGQVGVLAGWGGMYLLELIPAGICGLMPSLGAADLLQRVWTLAREDLRDQAADLFERILPQLVFSLQNLELYHFLEKHLLALRGIIPHDSTHVRAATWTPDDEALAHGQWLNARLAALAQTPAAGA